MRKNEIWKRKILLSLLVIVGIFTITGCDKKQEQNYTLGETFKINGFEITTDANPEYHNMNRNGLELITIPVKITNKTSNNNSLEFKFTVYGPNGTEVRLINNGLKDTSSKNIKLQSNGIFNDSIYFKYAGSGDYTITFDDELINLKFSLQ